MRLTRIALKGFRNFETIEVKTTEGLNRICGANGIGKTSILEAVWLAVTGQSFRTNHLKHLVHRDRESARVQIDFLHHGVSQSLLIELVGGKKNITLNKKPIKTSALIGTLPGISISPDDLMLVKGSPSARREFFDLFIGQIDPLYVHHFKRYHEALRQRNALLKNNELRALKPFEEEMAISGAYLIGKRKKATDHLAPHCSAMCSYLTKGTFLVEYLPQVEKSALLQALQEEREQAVLRGYTLHGPHRDDFSFFYNGLDLKTMGSEGEKKCGVLNLKLACWKMMEKQVGTKPLLLVDDYSAHLDGPKTERLMELLKDFGQVFLTTTLGSGNILLPESS